MSIFISDAQFKTDERIYYQFEVRLKGVEKMNDAKAKLFLALAAGRFICGLLALTGILFLAWVVEVIGKDGLSVQNILATTGAFCLNILFDRWIGDPALRRCMSICDRHQWSHIRISRQSLSAKPQGDAE